MKEPTDPIGLLAERVLGVLEETLRNLGELKVETFSTLVRGNSTVRTLRARTVIKLDGDTQVILPRGPDGQLDEPVWNAHLKAVDQALAARKVLLDSAVKAASGEF